MSDITMCEGKNCPKKEECKRCVEVPHSRQSYFIKVPYNFEKNQCDFYVRSKKNNG